MKAEQIKEALAELRQWSHDLYKSDVTDIGHEVTNGRIGSARAELSKIIAKQNKVERDEAVTLLDKVTAVIAEEEQRELEELGEIPPGTDSRP